MKISVEKQQKIKEQILAFLYQSFPRPLFTYYIAKEIARDEEFVKRLLLELKSKKLVIEIKKNNKGLDYSRRSRWKLSNISYNIYNEKQ